MKLPPILMLEKMHNATRGVYNKWRAAMTEKMGGKFDWGKVSKAEIIKLSDDMFNAAKLPEAVRKAYWQEWQSYVRSISK